MKKRDWISVDDELPPLGKHVYVAGPNLQRAKRFVAYRVMRGTSWDWQALDFINSVRVTHWSKIPKGMEQ